MTAERDYPTTDDHKAEALLKTIRDATAEYFREDLPEDGRDESETIADAILARFNVTEFEEGAP